MQSVIQAPYNYYTYARDQVKKLGSENVEERNQARKDVCTLISRICIAAAYVFANVLIEKLSSPSLRMVMRVLSVIPFALISPPAAGLGLGARELYMGCRFLSLIPTCFKVNKANLAVLCGGLGSLSIGLGLYWVHIMHQPNRLELENKIGIVPAMTQFLCRQWQRLDAR